MPPGQRMTSRTGFVPDNAEILGYLGDDVYPDFKLVEFDYFRKEAELIKNGMPKAERFQMVREIAMYQMKVLAETESIRGLPEGGESK